jgi:hypothetical protein
VIQLKVSSRWFSPGVIAEIFDDRERVSVGSFGQCLVSKFAIIIDLPADQNSCGCLEPISNTAVLRFG